MVAKLKQFKALNNMEKVFSIKDSLPDFIHSYEKAKTSMDNIRSIVGDLGSAPELSQTGRD